jgi:hypothetical protein
MPCQDSETGAERVAIGVFVTNLADVSITSTGTFYADFNVYLTDCNGSPYVPPETNELPQILRTVNCGQYVQVDKVLKYGSRSQEDISYWRVRSNFLSNNSVIWYPFDTQYLEIIVEMAHKPSSEITLVPNHYLTGLSSSIRLPGWLNFLGDKACSYETYTRAYPNPDFPLARWKQDESKNVTWSRYRMAIAVTRPMHSGVVKTLLPPTFILTVAALSFFLSVEHIATRFSICGTCLTSEVMFHVLLLTQLSGSVGLTFSDRFMIVCYVNILLAFALNVLLSKLLSMEKKDLAIKVAFELEWMVWVVVPLSFAPLFVNLSNHMDGKGDSTQYLSEPLSILLIVLGAVISLLLRVGWGITKRKCRRVRPEKGDRLLDPDFDSHELH